MILLFTGENISITEALAAESPSPITAAIVSFAETTSSSSTTGTKSLTGSFIAAFNAHLGGCHWMPVTGKLLSVSCLDQKLEYLQITFFNLKS